MTAPQEHLREPITAVARRDVATLREDACVGEALEMIRGQGETLGEKVVYFYVVDDEGRLTGVLPTRRLLTSAPHVPLREIMVRRVLSLPATATVLEGCEAFVLHKLLAFPVVDQDKRIVGMVDVGLLATIGSGTVCAVLAGFFEVTLAQSLRAACGLLVGLIAWVWRGTVLEASVIGGSIFAALLMACLLGLSVPTVLHALRLDPKVAAGPVTLALTDIFTIFFYLGLAALLLAPA